MPAQKLVYSPVGLDLLKYFPNKRDVPKALYVVHKIIEGRLLKKTKPDGYTHLYSTVLDKVLTWKRCKPVLTILEQEGVIEPLNNEKGRPSYQTKTESREGVCIGYRLGAEFRARPHEKVILQDRFILRKIEEHKARQKKWLNQQFPNVSGLQQAIEASLLKLRIDAVGAYRFTESEKFQAKNTVFTFTHPSCQHLLPFAQIYALKKGVLHEYRYKKKVFKINYEIPDTPLYYVPTFFNDGLKVPRYKHLRYWDSPVELSVPAKVKGVKNKTKRDFITLTAINGNRFESFRDLLPPGKTLRKFDFDRQSKYRPSQYNSDREYIAQWVEPGQLESYYTRDKAGRLYTNFVSSPKRLRPYHFLESGEQMVSIDIKTSQPAILNTLIAEHYRGQDLPEDCKLYRALTCDPDKDFYRYMMECFGLEITPESRNLFKAKFYRKIFYCKFYKNKSKYQQLFFDLFPNVYKILEIYKQPNYKRLPAEMQKRESLVMIDTVCFNLSRCPGAHFFFHPIHDSIETTASNADYVKAEIVKAFVNLYGFAPSLTVNPLKSW